MLKRTLALGLLLIAAAAAPTSAQAPAQPIFLPLVAYRSPTPNRLSLDIRTGAPDAAIPFAAGAGAAWARAGDVDWSAVEETRGAYRWEAAGPFEANAARIRAAGLEPTGIVQRTPLWATAVPGRVCGPPAPEQVAALEQFLEATARRYASGPSAVHVWQFGNEVDFQPSQIGDPLGSGCWGTAAAPFFGGDYYGEVLMRASAAIRRGNPRATVLAAGLAFFWPDDSQTLGFVRGMLASGSRLSFDELTFSGYGDYGVNDKMVLKAGHLRQVAAEMGLSSIPLAASEVGQVCVGACPANFDAIQASYAARIYAEAIAAQLDFASWYSLYVPGADPLRNGILLDSGGGVAATPAYYALRNSVALLRDARPAGAPLAPSDASGVRTLALLTPRGTMYVVWDPRLAGATAWLPLAPGQRATCTDRLDLPTPVTYDCTALARDGLLSVTATSPRYVEVTP